MEAEYRPVLAVRREEGKQPWAFYFVNDGVHVDGVRLVQVGYEHGDAGDAKAVGRELGAMAAGGFAEIWRDDDDAAELRMWLELEVRVSGRRQAVTFELPRLYKLDLDDALPAVGGRGGVFAPAHAGASTVDAVGDAVAALARTGAAGVEAVLQLIRVSPDSVPLVTTLRRLVSDHEVVLPVSAAGILAALLPESTAPVESWNAELVPAAIELLGAMGAAGVEAAPRLQAMLRWPVFEDEVRVALRAMGVAAEARRAVPSRDRVRARIDGVMPLINEMLEEPEDGRPTPEAKEAARAVVRDIFGLAHDEDVSVEKLAEDAARLKDVASSAWHFELLKYCREILR